jgi:hypothetical protein
MRASINLHGSFPLPGSKHSMNSSEIDYNPVQTVWHHPQRRAEVNKR